MTHDDPFVRHLQDLARNTPTVGVDPQGVLKAGRRRRAARRGGISVLAITAVTASAAGAVALLPTDQAPTPLANQAPTTTTATPTTTSTPDSAPDGSPAAVTFDAATGTVTKPIDAWRWTEQEAAINTAAYLHLRAVCMSDAGVPGYDEVAASISVPVIPDDGYATYGLWNESQLDGAGYTPRADPDGVVAEGADDDVPQDGSDLDQALACNEEGNDADLLYNEERLEREGRLPTGPSIVEVPGLAAESQAVLKAWATCVRAEGIETQAGEEGFYGLIPTVAPDANSAEVARIAAVDLGCKDELGSVEALADISTRSQASYIDQARERLTEVRAIQDTVLTASITYLQDQGITVPSYDPAVG